MNREQIIRMARGQGLPETETEGVFRVNTDDLGRMLAAERNKLAAWMMDQGYATGHGDNIEDLLKELEWQIEDRIKNIIRAKTTYVMQNDLAESAESDDGVNHELVVCKKI